MKMLTSLACTLGLVFLTSDIASATSISVLNASFEDLVLSPGSFSAGNIPNWTVSSLGDTSTWHPLSSSFSNPDGNNVAAAQNDATISQLLSATLQANMFYDLTVAVGSENSSAGGHSFSIGLYAHDGSGDHPLQTLVSSGLVENGLFSDYSVLFTATPVNPFLADNLLIRLGDLNGSRSLEVAFDNVRLTSTAVGGTPVPEPGTLLLLAGGVLGLGGRGLKRNR